MIIAGKAGLEVARAAPKRRMRMSFGMWVALARAAPLDNADDDAQAALVDTEAGAPGASSP